MPLANPAVSIGLPVYNGATYLATALDALLAQDFTDFELIVSDNASTDRSPDICAEYARRDPRIRFVGNDTNVGATANFNRTFELASGRYFMWAADDDLWDPRFLRTCVDALEAKPDAVLAATSIRFIDETGEAIDLDYGIYDNPDLSSRSVANRVRKYLRRGGWYLTYGLIRADALRQTSLFQNVYGPDVVLVLELALLGPFVKVPEVLYWYRQFGTRTEADRAARQGLPSGIGKQLFPGSLLAENLAAAIRRARLPWLTRQALLAELFRTAYVEDPIWRGRVRPELPGRLRQGVRERSFPQVAKFATLEGLARSRELAVAIKNRLASR
jgi:glycosyltransferase involved in cell wall biosynthesis